MRRRIWAGGSGGGSAVKSIDVIAAADASTYELLNEMAGLNDGQSDDTPELDRLLAYVRRSCAVAPAPAPAALEAAKAALEAAAVAYVAECPEWDQPLHSEGCILCGPFAKWLRARAALALLGAGGGEESK